MAFYSKPEVTVIVSGPLTTAQFRRIGELYGAELGRHKTGASCYHFGSMAQSDADAVTAFLRGQALPHKLETVTEWAP